MRKNLGLNCGIINMAKVGINLISSVLIMTTQVLIYGTLLTKEEASSEPTNFGIFRMGRTERLVVAIPSFKLKVQQSRDP